MKLLSLTILLAMNLIFACPMSPLKVHSAIGSMEISADYDSQTLEITWAEQGEIVRQAHLGGANFFTIEKGKETLAKLETVSVDVEKFTSIFKGKLIIGEKVMDINYTLLRGAKGMARGIPSFDIDFESTASVSATSCGGIKEVTEN